MFEDPAVDVEHITIAMIALVEMMVSIVRFSLSTALIVTGKFFSTPTSARLSGSSTALAAQVDRSRRTLSMCSKREPPSAWRCQELKTKLHAIVQAEGGWEIR